MIRQAQTYLAGAFSGTALIAAAVVAFVLLVSLQALRDWPLAGIGGSSGGGAQERGTPHEGGATGVGAATGARTSRAAVRRGAGGPGGERAHQTRADVRSTPAAGTQAQAPGSGQAGGEPTGASSGGESSSSGGSAGGAESSQSVTGTAAKTVDETVSGVDEATGGVLGETGVTKVTEEKVNGLLGAGR